VCLHTPSQEKASNPSFAIANIHHFPLPTSHISQDNIRRFTKLKSTVFSGLPPHAVRNKGGLRVLDNRAAGDGAAIA
jgi:hypothetical protein